MKKKKKKRFVRLRDELTVKNSRVTLETYLSPMQMAIFLAAASIRLTEVVASLRIPFSH